MTSTVIISLSIVSALLFLGYKIIDGILKRRLIKSFVRYFDDKIASIKIENLITYSENDLDSLRVEIHKYLDRIPFENFIDADIKNKVKRSYEVIEEARSIAKARNSTAGGSSITSTSQSSYSYTT